MGKQQASAGGAAYDALAATVSGKDPADAQAKAAAAVEFNLSQLKAHRDGLASVEAGRAEVVATWDAKVAAKQAAVARWEAEVAAAEQLVAELVNQEG